MWKVLLISCLFAAPPALDARLNTLRSQLNELRAIPVTPEAEAQAQASLTELEQLLESAPETGDEVDRIYRRLDVVRTWLLANAQEKPSTVPQDFQETAALWKVTNDELTLTVARDTLAMTVDTDGGTWTWEPSNDDDVVLRDDRSFSLADAGIKRAEPFHTGYSAGMCITLADLGPPPRASLDIVVHLIGREMVVEVVPVHDIDLLETIAFPKAIVTGRSRNDVAVIPRMQGMLLPGNWRQEMHQRELTQSRALYMPWWGQIAKSRGVQTIYETPDDAGVEYTHPSGGPTHIQPLWYSSLNRVRYPRIVRYVFDDDVDYVRMTKRYRRFVQERGEFVSLAEKRVRTPNLDKVIGKPVVHIGALYHTVQGSRFFREEFMERNHRGMSFDDVAAALRKLSDKGIESAYVHLDGWGYYGYDNAHPDIVPAGPQQGGWDALRRLANLCEELDFLFAVHDQYRDFYFSAVSYDPRLATQNWDGTRLDHAQWLGGLQSMLSPRFYPEYVRRNHDAFVANNVKVKGAYLDVFGVVPLEESFRRSHPITRTDNANYRRESCELLTARGYVVSTEEPTDFIVRSVALVHHGPYPTLPKGYGPGEGAGIAVPLFNLVYHDSILLPWHMTENGGWGIPNGDAGWLHCVLNAGLPYVSPNAGSGQIERVKAVSAIADRLGLLEMTDHTFLDKKRRVQQTTYSDGTRITVDFDQGTYEVAYPEAP